ncbi:MAG TPA: hypothetical protein VGG30_10865 [Pirellulales bacterium]
MSFVVRAARNCCVVALAVVLLPASGGSAAEPIYSPEVDRALAFHWFETLGYPDVAKLPFVDVATGGWSQGADDGPRAFHEHGFLLSHEGDRFSILTIGHDRFSMQTIGLETQKFTKTGPLTAAGRPVLEHQAVDYEPADLAQFATAALKAATERLTAVNPWYPTDEAELFVLSWACARQGHDALATDLFDCAASFPDEGAAKQAGRRGLEDRVSDQIAHQEMWRAIVAFGDAAISRQQLLDRFQWIIKTFPHSEHFERAKATATLLAMMIVEDRNHPAQPATGPEWERLDRKEQVAELIVQLRDQNTRQLMQPGSCSIFLRPDSDEDTPAHRLAKIGFDAVPQLIDALSDPRPTRSVGYLRDFRFSHHVLTVGDCAQQILNQIAGRSFFKFNHTGGYMAQDGRIDSVAAAAREWYAEVLKKGEKQTLIDGATGGDDQSVSQARRLLKKFPDDALPALIAATRAAKIDFNRNQLVGLVHQVPGEPAQEFLLEELRDGPVASTRLVAAKSLQRRGRSEGVAAMIEHWRAKHLPDPPCDPGAPDPESTDTHDVAIFLVSRGGVDGVKAVASRFADLPVALRLDIVSPFGDAPSLNVLRTGSKDDLARLGTAAESNDNQELRAAVVKLLITALDDTQPRKGFAVSWNGASISEPRICDFAGLALNHFDAARFPFDLSASLPERDRGRAILKNVWLKEQGKPELPLPAAATP